MKTGLLASVPIRTTWRDNAPALAVALAGAMLAASLFYTPIPFVVLLAIPAFFYFIPRPYELLLFMVFLIPFNFVFTIGPVPVAVELLKIFAWVPFLIHRANGGIRLKSSRYNKWFAVWAGILLLSVLRSNNLPLTIKDSVRLGSDLGLCYLVLNLVDSREKIFQVFRVLTVSTFIVACYGFYQWAIQDYGALFWIVNARLDTGLAPGRDVFWQWRGRMISVLTSEMELGHYFNLCLPIGVALWLTEGRGRPGSKWLLMTLAMLTGLLLTFTFGAWLALAATTALFVLLLDNKKRRWKMLLAGSLVLSLLASILIFGPLRPFVEGKALGTQVGSLAFDVVTRLDAWLFALQTWWSHPWLGVGVGSYQLLEYSHEIFRSASVPSGSTPQEAYLFLLAQSGIIGLASMLVLLLGTIWTNVRMKPNPRLGLIALTLAFALTTAMFSSFTDNSALFGPHAGYLFWLLVGLSEAVRNLAVAEPELIAAQPKIR